MGNPQVIYLILLAIDGTAVLFLHGKSRIFNFYDWCVSAAVVIGLLTWDGFFNA